MKCMICGSKKIKGECQYINGEYYHNICIERLTKENQEFQERIEYLERSNNRREDTILEQRQEISDLEDNWNKLKEFIDTLWLDDKGIIMKIKDKIELIEQGDSNVKEKED